MHITGPHVGAKSYRGILRYQMREMVDVRKITWTATKGVAEYRSDAKNIRHTYTIPEWRAGIAEYGARPHQYTTYGRNASLHHYFGTMAPRRIDLVESMWGGAPMEHGERCPCTDCGDWERVYQRDLEDADPRISGGATWCGRPSSESASCAG